MKKCSSLLLVGVVVANSKVVGFAPGYDPAIVIYNANALKIYNARGSLLRFVNKYMLFFYIKKTL
jgi:hypothetical protein